MAHLKKVPNGHLSKIPTLEPSPDCSNCADCDGGPGSTAILTVSGFTGDCAALNLTTILSRQNPCVWEEIPGSVGTATIICLLPNETFRIKVGDRFANDAICSPCSLFCILGAENPTGSGFLLGFNDCDGQTGSFTLT